MRQSAVAGIWLAGTLACLCLSFSGTAWCEPQPSGLGGELLETESEDLPASDANTLESAANPPQVGAVSNSETNLYPVARVLHEEYLLQPYYFSAETPALERTEVNLGLFLSQTPGVNISLTWGALQDLMFSAKMAAFGASSLVGISLKYRFLPEISGSSKPAMAWVFQTLFLNDRTLDEPRENIYRGTRLQTGVAFTKDLGILAESLSAQESLRIFLSSFRVHAQMVLEYQNGRTGWQETSESQILAGAKAALETVIVPKELYVSFVWDTLPDWVDTQNYYLGVRYFTSPDLAFDVIAGRLQNCFGADVSISWIF
jgi:hypothetical protein